MRKIIHIDMDAFYASVDSAIIRNFGVSQLRWVMRREVSILRTGFSKVKSNRDVLVG